MPIVNGLEATKIIKEIRPDIIIIAQTAFARPDDITKAREAGCDDYLAKPISREQLLEMMQSNLKP